MKIENEALKRSFLDTDDFFIASGTPDAPKCLRRVLNGTLFNRLHTLASVAASGGVKIDFGLDSTFRWPGILHE